MERVNYWKIGSCVSSTISWHRLCNCEGDLRSIWIYNGRYAGVCRPVLTWCSSSHREIVDEVLAVRPFT